MSVFGLVSLSLVLEGNRTGTHSKTGRLLDFTPAAKRVSGADVSWQLASAWLHLAQAKGLEALGLDLSEATGNFPVFGWDRFSRFSKLIIGGLYFWFP